MNPDFAIILNFKIKDHVNADFLVKTARNIGARAVMTNTQIDNFKQACAKYTILLADQRDGLDLTSQNAIDTIVNNRKNGQNTIVNVPVTNGDFDEKTQKLLDLINSWMHLFGHALNEGKPCALNTDAGFVLENRHANYQKYVFIKKPLPEKITVSGLEKEPNRVEWIENRTDLKFAMKQGKLTINLTQPDNQFDWQVLRIQAHRPEDDILNTKF